MDYHNSYLDMSFFDCPISMQTSASQIVLNAMKIYHYFIVIKVYKLIVCGLFHTLQKQIVLWLFNFYTERSSADCPKRYTDKSLPDFLNTKQTSCILILSEAIQSYCPVTVIKRYTDGSCDIPRTQCKHVVLWLSQNAMQTCRSLIVPERNANISFSDCPRTQCKHVVLWLSKNAMQTCRSLIVPERNPPMSFPDSPKTIHKHVDFPIVPKWHLSQYVQSYE